MVRRLLAFAALVSGALAGLALVRRLGGGPHDRVDLYYDDGSLVTLDADEAEPLLALARDALSATRG